MYFCVIKTICEVRVLNWTKAQIGRYRFERFEERFGDIAAIDECSFTCERVEYPHSMKLGQASEGSDFLLIAEDGMLFYAEDNGNIELMDPPGVRALRKYTKLTQEAFGRRYSIPWRTVQNWERDGREVALYIRRLLMRCVFEDFE